jgi:uncharacterized protein YfaS (alpha-2-macroglobulin family)
MVTDPLPAGFEIDNPNLISAGDIGTLDWLDALQAVRAFEFRQDRFLTAVDWTVDRPLPAGLHRARGVARAVPPPGGLGRGHVPPRLPGDRARSHDHDAGG